MRKAFPRIRLTGGLARLVGLIGLVGVAGLACSDNSTTTEPNNNSSGNSSVADTTPPNVIFAYPGGVGTQSGCEVAWGSPVVVAFSEPIAPASVSAASFTVGGSADGRFWVCGNTVTFEPRLAFNNLVVLEVVVGGTVTDTAGNPMGDDYKFMFHTRGEP